mmetsp:Transcript_2777/g.2667  ORF Transcript_2777/g.2667 Transcript_2777/m.2667 type:complete len:89 (-) Transcript_2777:78-344(-)
MYIKTISKSNMAEAMIDNEYMAASLPTLAPPESRSVTENFYLKNQSLYNGQDEERTCGKVVGFDLPPSPKRQKTCYDLITHQMVISGK